LRVLGVEIGTHDFHEPLFGARAVQLVGVHAPFGLAAQQIWAVLFLTVELGKLDVDYLFGLEMLGDGLQIVETPAVFVDPAGNSVGADNLGDFMGPQSVDQPFQNVELDGRIVGSNGFVARAEHEHLGIGLGQVDVGRVMELRILFQVAEQHLSRHHEERAARQGEQHRGQTRPRSGSAKEPASADGRPFACRDWGHSHYRFWNCGGRGRSEASGRLPMTW